MSNTHTNSLHHFVWSTKRREPLLLPDIQSDLYQYMGGILRNLNGALLEAGGMPDHIHLLVLLPPSISISEAINRIKSSTSRWLKSHPTVTDHFAWQTGYSAFSVSHSQKDKVVHYIRHQADHHRNLSFRDELLRLLRLHDIPFDGRYVFD